MRDRIARGAALVTSVLLLAVSVVWMWSVAQGPWRLDTGAGCVRGVPCVQPPEALVVVGLLATGALGAWGTIRRRWSGLAWGAAAFVALWLVFSGWILLHRHGQTIGHELASTVRQHGAFVVLVGGAYLGAAATMGWRPGRSGRLAIAGVATLLAAVSLAGFAAGAPYRWVPPTPMPLVFGGLALAAASLGWHARNGPAFALAALLLLAAGMIGALRHLALDPEPSVAILSYGGPGGLTLLPAAVLLLHAARRRAEPGASKAVDPFPTRS